MDVHPHVKNPGKEDDEIAFVLNILSQVSQDGIHLSNYTNLGVIM